MTNDPRIEAVTRVVAPAVHHWHDGLIADCVLCQGVAAEALAAADAVDRLRAPGVMRVSEPDDDC